MLQPRSRIPVIVRDRCRRTVEMVNGSCLIHLLNRSVWQLLVCRSPWYRSRGVCSTVQLSALLRTSCLDNTILYSRWVVDHSYELLYRRRFHLQRTIIRFTPIKQIIEMYRPCIDRLIGSLYLKILFTRFNVEHYQDHKLDWIFQRGSHISMYSVQWFMRNYCKTWLKNVF